MSENRRRKSKDFISGPSFHVTSYHQDARHDNPAGVITLITDFGLDDAYVGTMKGVIASVNPRALVIDVCHEVTPQDVRGAAFLLAGAFEFFPEGTIHMAVVDPTVGSERAALCVESGGHYFIGPDNGVLSIACYRAGRPKIYLLENEEYFLERRSRTFHGRDVFAPAAAHLAANAPIETMGPQVRSMKRIRVARPTARRGAGVGGRIVYIDRFGNLTTNIGLNDIRRAFPRARLENLVISFGEHKIRGINSTYSDARPGSALALFGSYDLMEIAVRDGSAASQLGVGRGEKVFVSRGGR
jgi:S-adenosylmethionine hydrolase